MNILNSFTWEEGGNWEEKGSQVNLGDEVIKYHDYHISSSSPSQAVVTVI